MVYVLALACLWKYTHSEDSDTASLESKSNLQTLQFFLLDGNYLITIPGKTNEDDVAGASAARPPSPLPKLGAIPKTCVTKRSHRHHRAMRQRRPHHGDSLDKDSRRETKKQINERENGIIDEEDTAPTHVVRMRFLKQKFLIFALFFVDVGT